MKESVGASPVTKAAGDGRVVEARLRVRADDRVPAGQPPAPWPADGHKRVGLGRRTGRDAAVRLVTRRRPRVRGRRGAGDGAFQERLRVRDRLLRRNRAPRCPRSCEPLPVHRPAHRSRDALAVGGGSAPLLIASSVLGSDSA